MRSLGDVKRPVTGGMKVRAYEMLRRAVEEGVAYGWQRSHKHTHSPGGDAVQDQIVTAVLSEVCEVFSFDNDDGA